MIRAAIRRLFRLGVRRDDVVRQDVNAEIATHIALRIEQLVAAGLSRNDARAEALRRFGSLEVSRQSMQHSANHRERTMSLRESMDALHQDVTYALRGVRREPLLTTFIVATFALGIGANATMFEVVNRLMLSGPRHVTESDQVRRLYLAGTRPDGRPFTNSIFAYAAYGVLRQANLSSFDGVAAYSIAPGLVRHGRGELATTVDLGAATASLFPLLGTQPQLGRFFTNDEDRTTGADHVVVLGDGFWHREFNADRAIVGKTIALNDEQWTVIGVAPRGFTGPELGRVDVWMPMSWWSIGRITNWPTAWNGQWVQLVGRIKPDVSLERAEAEATLAFRNGYGGSNPAVREGKASLSARPLIYARDGSEPPELAVSRWLVGVTAIVLIIACSNVVNLLLARAVRRRREVAVRVALGAGRARIVRLLLTESLVFAFLGWVASIGVAYGMGQLIRGALIPNVDWVSPPVNATLLIVSAAIAAALGIAAGLVPAYQAGRTNLSVALKSGVRDGGGHSWRLRNALTVSQAALSVVLLVGAGLFVVSLARVRALDLGIQPDRVLVANIAWPGLSRQATQEERDGERARQTTVYQQVIGRLRTTQGVEHASVAVGLPFQYAFSQTLRVAGWDSLPVLSSGPPRINAIGSRYFETVGSRVVRGRAFDETDRDGSEPVAIVNETMAATLWPGRDPIGECIYTATNSAPCSRIVGISVDARRSSLREDPGMQYYVPFGQERGIGGTTLLVRPAGSHARAIATIRHLVHEIDPTISIVRISSLQDAVDPQIRPWRLGATVFALMGLLALAVAAAGLYSVMAYLVAQRTHEIGVRVALGASGRNIAALVVRNGVGLAAIGVAIGVGVALALGRFIAPLLFETSPRDVTVIATVVVALLGVALVATWAPAMRARRVNPITALKAD